MTTITIVIISVIISNVNVITHSSQSSSSSVLEKICSAKVLRDMFYIMLHDCNRYQILQLTQRTETELHLRTYWVFAQGSLFSGDCFGNAAFVRRMTTKTTPAKKRKSPSIPSCLINTGFIFTRLNAEAASNVAMMPATVDLG